MRGKRESQKLKGRRPEERRGFLFSVKLAHPPPLSLCSPSPIMSSSQSPKKTPQASRQFFNSIGINFRLNTTLTLTLTTPTPPPGCLKAAAD